MVCTRSLQLSVKKTKTEQKTLESLLLTKDPNTGEQVSLSSRCAELDAEIPLHLGVSKAILENVIFCHQEDANWPLSEPSVLKKKFDEIFASTRYTKALDTVKSLKKEQLTEIKLDEQKLEFCKTERERAQKIELNITAYEKKIRDNRDRIRALEGEMDSIQLHIRDTTKQLTIIESGTIEYTKKKHEKAVLLQSLEELEQHMTRIEGSEDELNQLHAHHAREQQDETIEIERLEESKLSTTCEFEQVQSEHMRVTSEQGRLVAQKQAFEDRRVSIEKQLEWVESVLLIASPSIDLPSRISVARRAFNKMKDEVTKAASSLREREKAIQAKLQSSLTGWATAREKRAQLQSRADEQESRSVAIEAELEKFRFIEQELALSERNLDESKRELEDLRKTLGSSSLSERLAEIDRHQLEMDAGIENIQKRLRGLKTAHDERQKTEERRRVNDEKKDQKNQL